MAGPEILAVAALTGAGAAVHTATQGGPPSPPDGAAAAKAAEAERRRLAAGVSRSSNLLGGKNFSATGQTKSLLGGE